jgi:hypothetical protein
MKLRELLILAAMLVGVLGLAAGCYLMWRAVEGLL